MNLPRSQSVHERVVFQWGGKIVPHRTSRKILAGLTVATFVLAFVSAIAAPAGAKQTKSTSNEAEWISYDSTAKIVKVKITKKGKGPNSKALKAKQEVTFNVIPEGSILKRTSVAINGVKGEIQDIPEGKTVLIYWIPDPNKDGEYFARKIDVIMSDEELDARYGTEP
jgi:hypothetical protein